MSLPFPYYRVADEATANAPISDKRWSNGAMTVGTADTAPDGVKQAVTLTACTQPDLPAAAATCSHLHLFLLLLLRLLTVQT